VAALKLELNHFAPLPRALAFVRAVRSAALAQELEGLAPHALQREVDLLLAADPERARRLAHELAEAPEQVVPTDGYRADLWLLQARCAGLQGDPQAQTRWLGKAVEWIAACAENLPAGLRQRFLTVNPHNISVAAEARRLGGLGRCVARQAGV